MASGAGHRHTTVMTEDLARYMQEAGPGFNLDLMRRLKWGTQGSTIHLVSNCEDVTDWDISDSTNFNAVNDTTDKRVGSNAIELVDAGTTTGTYVTLDDGHRPNDEDWSEFNWLCMWLHDDTGLRLAGELKFQIRNNGTWSTATAVPLCTTADTFELRCIDISDFDRNHVDGFRFVNNRGTGSDEKVYVDYIFVTDIITGLGAATALAVGPYFGPIVALPMTTGATIVPGDPVIWTTMGVNTASSGSHNIIGIACQHEATTSTVAADATPKEILVGIGTGIFFARNDGTGMATGDYGKLGSDVISESGGGAAGNAEDDFAVSLETASTTAWKSGDSAYQLVPRGAEG